jgi:NAD-dependent deacetylase
MCCITTRHPGSQPVPPIDSRYGKFVMVAPQLGGRCSAREGASAAATHVEQLLLVQAAPAQSDQGLAIALRLVYADWHLFASAGPGARTIARAEYTGGMSGDAHPQTLDGGEGPIETAARLIASARSCVALVGAGISKESGVPTFRGAGGIWTRDGEPPMNGFQRFLADPEAWWRSRLAEQQRPGELAQAIAAAKPNAGHLALAELEQMGRLQTIITQNIDNLHQQAGSRSILEIHGNRTLLRCLGCGRRFEPAAVSTDPLPPRCEACGGIIKSDTVMFGEPIPEATLEACYKAARGCDCMLIVGTSAVVYPAAELPLLARRRGADLIEVNPDRTPLTHSCRVILRGAAGVVLPQLVDALRRASRRA